MSAGEKEGKVELSGSGLLVYWYLMKKGKSCGVREIQRVVGFSSSSTAHYHLDRLASRGVLIRDSYGNYRVNENVRVGRTSPFIFMQGFVLPKQTVYATITSLMCLIFLILFKDSLTLQVMLALSPGIVASIIFWYDAARVWRSLPSLKRDVR